tara:strand:- start:15845 stop:17125 length:1281 start_codon:yes stop_codon:yes gene_type:complete
MKKNLNKILEFIGHFFIYFSCYFNMPGFCSYLISISILKKKFYKKKIKAKKICIVLDRAIGHRDVEIIQETTTKAPEFLFMRRSITRIILFYFCNNKKIFFNYVKPPVNENDYFKQSNISRKRHEKFWSEVIFNLKNNYQNKTLSFVTFNFTYFAEAALYAGCRNNGISVKLWHKEGIKTDLEAELEAKTWGVKFRHIFKYFTEISVYNELVKKMFIKIDKSNSKKTTVNGCPRIKDYLIKKKYNKKVNTLLFLSFDSKRGIPEYNKNKNLTWKLSYNKVIKILNELSKNKNLRIIIKRKSNSTKDINNNIDKKIKIFSKGTAKHFINQADIIIGHNSASTIEALVNGKYVMVPFFEKNLKLKKYLYNFNKELIYNSEKNMKKSILNLLNKKVFFPLNNKKHHKTIKYYLGNTKNTTEKYLKFLNS